MADVGALEEYYKGLTNQELLNLGGEGGFTDDAEIVFLAELARRKLGQNAVKRFVAVTERRNLREEVVERGGGYRSPGIQFFGKSYQSESDKEANIQIRTKWFTMSGIPLIPIASYRFKCTSGTGKWFPKNTEQRVIERVPLNWAQVVMTWITTAVLIVGGLLLVVGVAWFVDFVKH